MNRLIFIVFSTAFLAVRPCSADSSGIPVEWVAYAGKGEFIARVIPAVSSQDGYSIEKPSRIQVLRLTSSQNGYEQVSIFSTQNGATPLKLLMTDDGRRLVALDESCGMGRGEHAIVVYDGSGRVLSSWKLDQILTADERKKVTESVSSTWWREKAYLVGSEFIFTGPARVLVGADVGKGYAHILDLESQKWER